MLDVLDNRWVVLALSIVVACYAGYAAPKLSPAALRVVTSDWFRLAIVFLVAYLPRKDFFLALAISVAFVAASRVAVDSERE